MLRVESSVSRYQWNLESWGADVGEAAGSVSEDRSLFPGAADKEGGGS